MAAVEPEAMVAREANSSILRKRKSTNRKSNKKPNKKLKPVAKSKKPTQRMQKLYKKRAREYNSDEEEEEEDQDVEIEVKEQFEEEVDSSDEEYKNHDIDDDDEDEYEETANTAITKFLEGCNAFKVAFQKIMKKHVPNDSLGPILSAHKKLVAEKLLEEENEHIAMKKKKKDKQLAGEKSHIKPDSFLNAKEKELIQIATRGVVKFFNQVNKVQYSQKGLNVSKDGRGVKRRRNQPLPVNAETPMLGSFKVIESSDDKESEQKPGWAPLRDNYMLADSKFKDWNEMPDSDAGGDDEAAHMESSSDDD